MRAVTAQTMSNAGASELTLEMVREAAAFVRARMPPAFAPSIAFVCGSGLGGVAEALVDKLTLPYGEIPYFPQSTVKGHSGTLHALLLLLYCCY